MLQIAFITLQARRQSVLFSLPPPAIFVVVKAAESDSDRVSRPARLLPASSGVDRGPLSSTVYTVYIFYEDVHFFNRHYKLLWLSEVSEHYLLKECTLRRRAMLGKRRKRRHTKNVISFYLNLTLLYMRVRRQPIYLHMLI